MGNGIILEATLALFDLMNVVTIDTRVREIKTKMLQQCV